MTAVKESTINVEHTYTMVSYKMDINGKSYVIREGINAHNGDQEVRTIEQTTQKGEPMMKVQQYTEEWDRLEQLFQQNRID